MSGFILAPSEESIVRDDLAFFALINPTYSTEFRRVQLAGISSWNVIRKRKKLHSRFPTRHQAKSNCAIL